MTKSFQWNIATDIQKKQELFHTRKNHALMLICAFSLLSNFSSHVSRVEN